MIVNVLLTIAAIVVAFFLLGFCVLIHELSHFLVAKWRGMHIDRFSIGFGKRLWGFKRDGVDFVISALPFGGYVALPQLDPTEEPQDEEGNPLSPAKPMDRIYTAAAGPLSNILFGLLLASILWAVKLERPVHLDEYVVASVQEESPEYEAGLRAGDIITKVNGEEVAGTRKTLLEKIIFASGEVTLIVARDGESRKIEYTKKGNPQQGGAPYPFFDVKVPVVAEFVGEDSPARKAGIKLKDRLLAVNGEPVLSPMGFIDLVDPKQADPVDVTVERDGERITFEQIEPAREEIEGETRYLIGIRPGVKNQLKHVPPWILVGEVLDMTQRTVKAVASPSSGVGVRHLSGPIGIISWQYRIIRYASWRAATWFLFLITINLGILNLLPIPVLDGGHIVFGAIEGVTRRRVPPKVAQVVQTFFAVIIISFFLYVTFWDVAREAGNIFDGNGKDKQEQTPEDAPAE